MLGGKSCFLWLWQQFWCSAGSFDFEVFFVVVVYALPVGLSQDKINPKYAPAQHIFYDSRIVDVSDTLPKYVKMPVSSSGEPFGPASRPFGFTCSV